MREWEEEEEQEARRCTECGMEDVEWRGNQGLGYRREGAWYCCQGCAEDTGCTCGEEVPAPVKAKPRSGRRARQR